MRKKTTFTIEKTILDTFNKKCDEKTINKSKLMEKLIKEWMKKN